MYMVLHKDVPFRVITTVTVSTMLCHVCREASERVGCWFDGCLATCIRLHWITGTWRWQQQRRMVGVIYTEIYFIFTVVFDFIAHQHSHVEAQQYRNSVCPSVCLSRSGIVVKLLNISSQFLHHMVTRSF